MADTPETSDGFLRRWSQRKREARQETAAPPKGPQGAGELRPAAPQAVAPADSAPALPASTVETPASAAATVEAPPALTLDDVAQLSRSSDYAPFVAREVRPEVRNAALKRLFTDPQFNVMDGLDVYIDDYGKPDPLPAGMLRQMVQSQLLGLFKDEAPQPPAGPDAPAAEPTAADEAPAAHAAAAETPPPCEPALPAAAPCPTECTRHEDADLQLQPDPAAGPGCAAARAGADAGREH